jgi:hypothetical protein
MQQLVIFLKKLLILLHLCNKLVRKLINTLILILLCGFRLMRSDILASAILCGIEDVVKEAKNKFDEWMYENKRIPPNMREVIYLAGENIT